MKRLWRKLKKNKGMSLIEVLISVAILAMIVAPILGVFHASLRNTVFSQRLIDGTYIAQSIIEEYRGMDYETLAYTPPHINPHDSDGDGMSDCYVRVRYYPVGSHNDLANGDPSYLHIIYLIDDVLVVGSNGVHLRVPSDNMTLTYDMTTADATLQVGTGEGSSTLHFKKDRADSELIVLVNLASKSYGETFSLAVNGPSTNVHVVEYALDVNYEELQCSELLESNIYHGINDYNTSLVHMEVEVFREYDESTKIGCIEDTFEIINRAVTG